MFSSSVFLFQSEVENGLPLQAKQIEDLFLIPESNKDWYETIVIVKCLKIRMLRWFYNYALTFERKHSVECG